MTNKNEQDSTDKAVDAGLHAAGGAAAGAGVAAAVGGMGLAVGGGAIAIGMLPVAAAGAVVGLAFYGIKKAMEE
jgi:hypothetical protein